MAKQNVTFTEDDRGFLVLQEDNTEEQHIVIKGWHFDQPGVLLKKIVETKDKAGAVIGTEILFELYHFLMRLLNLHKKLIHSCIFSDL